MSYKVAESAKYLFADQVQREQTTENIKISSHLKTFGIPHDCLVELRGFEPLTSAVRLQRSPI